jgi:hypothetical protein
MSLTPAEQAVVREATRLGLLEQQSPPAYLPAWSCTVVSFVLVPPTLGLSLLMVPLLWVAQHHRTTQRLLLLEENLKRCGHPVADTALADVLR